MRGASMRRFPRFHYPAASLYSVCALHIHVQKIFLPKNLVISKIFRTFALGFQEYIFLIKPNLN